VFSSHFAFFLSLPRRLILARIVYACGPFGLALNSAFSFRISRSISCLVIWFPLSFLLYSTLVKVSCQLKLSENVGEFIGDYRRAVSGRITDASDVVSLLCTGVYLSLTHIEDGEGLTVDDFRFDDFDIHFSFLFFLSFWLYPIIPTSSSKVKRSLEFFLDLVISLMIPSTYVIWIFFGGHWTLL